jgi:hypothetical protein
MTKLSNRTRRAFWYAVTVLSPIIALVLAAGADHKWD